MQNGDLNADRILDRLAQAVGAKSDQEMSAYLGVARGTVSSWRSRGTVPYRHCIDAAKRSDTSLEWLINGRGPCAADALETPVEGRAPADPYQQYLLDHYQLIGKGGIRLAAEDGGILPFPENSFPVAFKSRYVANLCADLPGPAVGYMCRDDCMEPTIMRDWCVLVAKAENEISEPGIYAIVLLDSGTQTFRRITPLGHEIHLHCDNPAYAPMILDVSSSPCPISILGRAVWSGGYLA